MTCLPGRGNKSNMMTFGLQSQKTSGTLAEESRKMQPLAFQSVLYRKAHSSNHTGDQDPSLVNNEALEKMKQNRKEISESINSVQVITVLFDTHLCAQWVAI